MKSLLIVEDEKMIRQGLVKMVERSGVPVDEILDCRNGAEALEILKSRRIDMMFTDIRMPKMDGISLIHHMQELPDPPKTVVISGYDDFSYAVEALRGGVYDYILKPIDRGKVHELLLKAEQALKKEQTESDRRRELSRQQLRYIIMNNQLPESELAELETEIFIEKDYRISCCCCKNELVQRDLSFLQICEVNGQSVFLADDTVMRKLEEGPLQSWCVGVSGVHRGVRELHQAYEEALAARKEAFVTGRSHMTDKEMGEERFSGGADDSNGFWKEAAEEGQGALENLPEQFVQQFGTDKVQAGLKQLRYYYFLAQKGHIDSGELLDMTMKILEQLYATYKNALAIDMAGYEQLRQPLAYNDAPSYLEDFNAWVQRMRDNLTSEFKDYRNKEKINMAVAYIRQNYDKELNMAMVSNYISMNYSLFSLSFKQYTGMNFVNYLKMIRINEAKRLLVETEKKIVDISQMVGYENERHFMKTFKNVCGVSPSEYRRNMMLGKMVLNSREGK